MNGDREEWRWALDGLRDDIRQAERTLRTIEDRISRVRDSVEEAWEALARLQESVEDLQRIIVVRDEQEADVTGDTHNV